jgi:hypothetical protein
VLTKKMFDKFLGPYDDEDFLSTGPTIVGDAGHVSDNSSFVDNNKKIIFKMSIKLNLAKSEFALYQLVDTVAKYGPREMAMLLIDSTLGSKQFNWVFKYHEMIAVSTGMIAVTSVGSNFNIDASLLVSSENAKLIDSGIGDGWYPLYICKKGSQIVGIYMDFFASPVVSNISPMLGDYENKKDKKTSKKDKKKGRPSPGAHAADQKTGTIKTGNDKNKWIVKENKNEVKRWAIHKKRDRPGPSGSAARLKIGTTKKGNDGCQYKVVDDKNGVKRWKKI